MSLLSDMEKAGVPDEMLERMREYFREDYDPNNQLYIDESIVVESIIYRVSTVDLGVNLANIHNDLDVDMPVLNETGIISPEYFETMVFIAEKDIYCRRYANEEEARQGHEDIKQSIICGELNLQDGWLRSSGGLSSGKAFHDIMRWFRGARDDENSNDDE